jgi:Redoxin
MPALGALHDKFADQNLVAIAVHDGSVKSIAEMDERIAGTSQTRWFGRALPFLVALDGDGATTAAFGITTFPTFLLIDRDGNVVQRGMLPLAEPDAFGSIHNGHQRVFRQSERPPARRSCRLATE